MSLQIIRKQLKMCINRYSKLHIAGGCLLFVVFSIFISYEQLQTIQVRLFESNYSAKNDNSNSTNINNTHDDSCAIHVGATNDVTTATNTIWKNYTQEESNLYYRLLLCNNRLWKEDEQNKFEDIPPPPNAKMSCNSNIDNIEPIITKYDKIWFIGDSVLRQVYTTLVCRLMPNIAVTFQQMSNTTIVTYPYEYDHAMNNYSNHDAAHNKTILTYHPCGFKFNKDELGYYQHFLPKAIGNSTENDAIIINAGLHYDHENGPKLEKLIKFISNETQQTNASIFFIESTAEQWPTSNGIFSRSCLRYCKCEPLTKDRVIGRGALFDHITGDLVLHSSTQRNESLQKFYESYFPHLFKNVSDYSSLISVPSYLPAYWRNKITNSVLKQSAPHIKIVPIWQQLVDRNMTNSIRAGGDCTHKSLHAVTAIVEQLSRSM